MQHLLSPALSDIGKGSLPRVGEPCPKRIWHVPRRQPRNRPLLPEACPIGDLLRWRRLLCCLLLQELQPSWPVSEPACQSPLRLRCQVSLFLPRSGLHGPSSTSLV